MGLVFLVVMGDSCGSRLAGRGGGGSEGPEGRDYRVIQVIISST